MDALLDIKWQQLFKLMQLLLYTIYSIQYMQPNSNYGLALVLKWVSQITRHWGWILIWIVFDLSSCCSTASWSHHSLLASWNQSYENSTIDINQIKLKEVMNIKWLIINSDLWRWWCLRGGQSRGLSRGLHRMSKSITLDTDIPYNSNHWKKSEQLVKIAIGLSLILACG